MDIILYMFHRVIWKLKMLISHTSHPVIQNRRKMKKDEEVPPSHEQ